MVRCPQAVDGMFALILLTKEGKTMNIQQKTGMALLSLVTTGMIAAAEPVWPASFASDYKAKKDKTIQDGTSVALTNVQEKISVVTRDTATDTAGYGSESEPFDARIVSYASSAPVYMKNPYGLYVVFR